jgi:hypothetical protein
MHHYKYIEKKRIKVDKYGPPKYFLNLWASCQALVFVLAKNCPGIAKP